MKYSVVKQFSNFAIDNAYSFVFKIIDFGKILRELFWGFLDIWAAFFGIFYNFLMYIYYLFLFMIDRGSEASGPSFIGMKKSQSVSKIPGVPYDRTPSVIPSMYKKKGPVYDDYEPVKPKPASAAPKVMAAPKAPAAVAKTTETVQGTPPAQAAGAFTSLKSSPKGAKKSFFKVIAEFIAEYFTAVKNIIVKPFKFIGGLFAKKLQPVKETEPKNVESSKGISLIDQYMKEYEKKKR